MLYWDSLTLKAGPIGYPKPEHNYHFMLHTITTLCCTQLPLYAAHDYHFMLHTITTLCYTQLPLYATHNYHFMLHTITTLCYTQLPLYATHNYHFLLHTITTLCCTQLPLYATHNYHFMLHRITTLCYTQSQITAGLKTCSNSVCPYIRRTQNGGIQMCSVTLLQKMSTGVKSHDLPHQAISSALSNQHLCSRFKSFVSKNHHT